MLSHSPYCFTSVDCDFQGVVSLTFKARFVADAVLKICLALRVAPGQSVENGGGDEVVP